MKNRFKKELAFLLTLVLFSSLFTGVIPAYAMDLSQGYEVSWDYVLTDAEGNTFSYYVGMRASDNTYGYALSERARSMHDYTVKRNGLGDDKSQWMYDKDYLYAFCIEMGIPIEDVNDYKGSSSYAQGNKWGVLSESQRDLLLLALSYGYPNRSDLQTSKDANACYAATQLIVWQIAMNFRTSVISLNDKTYPMSGYTGTMTEQLTRNPYLKTFYDRILHDMAVHYTIPSFARSIAANALSFDMTQSGGQYSVTLTDTNNVLSDFYVSSSAGLNCNISGNTLTITSGSPITSLTTIKLNRRMPRTTSTTGFLIWSVPGQEGDNQDMVTGCPVSDDPVPAYLKLAVSTGTLSIIKTSQHNNGGVSGFQFEVRNSSGILIGTYTSGANGVINIPDLLAGTYSVREINLSSDFVTPTPNPKSVTVLAGQTASVSFDNIKKRGVITIKKVDANPALGGYSLAGAVFEIRDAGSNLVDTVTTDAQGNAASKVLSLGVYRITEKSAPYGFIRITGTTTVILSGTQGAGEIVYAPISNQLEQPQPGRINIVKANSNPNMGNYDLAGAVFEIFDSNGQLADTVVTDSAGRAQSKDLKLGDYTVKEKTAPYGFVLNPGSHNVTLAYAGQDQTISYSTVNVPQRPQTGIIRIHKTNANPVMGDYGLNGAVFEVRSRASGDLADTIATNAEGFAQTKELPLGQYTVREKTAPYGFVLNTNEYNPTLTYAGQTVEVTYTDVTIPERPQTGTITVTKLDQVTGEAAQGDATLNGAVFEIYDSAKQTVLDTLYCGSDSVATSKELKLGTYYYREKTPPVGYTHDPAFYEIKIEYAGQNVTIVKKYGEVKNKVIEGQIALVKHTDLPDPDVDPENPQIEMPLEGATFEVYLKTSGGYDSAKPTERDFLTTNADGYAVSKKLPYGIYTVKEIYAPGDVKLVAPFDVFISSDGRVYRFILNDPTFRSLVKILKVDAETGKTVPAAGIAFKVKDLSTGKWVVQHINYPTPIDIDVYETAPDGTLVMPSSLPSGDYELYEQQAPYGYILSKDPVRFTVHSAQTDPEIIEVMLANAPAKGIIKLSKTGNMLTGVQEIETEFGTQYVPVFAPIGLKGAVFNIIAAEDIITPDGTLRYANNAVVDTIITGADGSAESKQLYLGNYKVVEVTAPTGFVLDDVAHNVSLVYEGQEVPVVSSQIGVLDIRQQVEIALQKLMEQPVNAPQAFNPFADVTFGLFSDQDIKAADGTTVIPKGGLIALILVDDNGKGTLSGELPFANYYVQELKTNPYYTLDDTKYPIKAEYKGQEMEVAKIQVNNGGLALPNELKLGQITVLKKGEVLVGAVQTETDDNIIYTPVYEERGLPGAVFNIVVAQDIYNVYGKRIHSKGDVVDTITTGADGRATSKLLHLGHYELAEITAPEGFVLLPEPQKVTLGLDGVLTEILSKEVPVTDIRQKAQLNLSKEAEIPDKASSSYNPYADIQFGICAAEDIKSIDGVTVITADSLVEVLNFDAAGHTETKTDLPFGSYYAQELKTAPGYALDTAKYPFSFAYGAQTAGTVVIDINAGNPVLNELQRGDLEVIKTFEDQIYPMAGIPFTVTGKTVAGTDYFGEFVTDENGKIVIEDLLIGNYTVQELESPLSVGYVLSEAQNAKVAADQIAQLTINNVLQRGSLKIIKTFEGRTVPIAGVPFTVTGKTTVGTDFISTYYTDANGEILIEDLLVGDYAVQELNSDLTVGYILSEEQAAVVAHEQLTELTLDNKLQRGDLKIVKTFESKEKPISGVPFTVEGTSLAGMEFSKTFYTDENGEIFIEGLPVGQYTVKELDDSLTTGYVLSKTQTAVIVADALTTLTIDNKLQRGSLKIVKTFEDREIPIAGVPFLITGTSVTGLTFSETLYTNAEGVVLVEGLPVGEYAISELGCEQTIGYVLAPDQTIKITADKVTELNLENKLQRGGLKVIKTFEGRETPIEGVSFRITGKTAIGTEYSEVFKTDKNGEILIENLLIGDYTVTELESELTGGFVLADPQAVVILTDEVATVTVGNKLIRGSVTLTKVDAEHPDKKLSGAVFEVYADTNGNKELDEKDILIGEMKEGEKGVYGMTNLPYGGYFVLEKIAPSGFIRDEQPHYFAIEKDGETVTVENEAGKGFVNSSQRGSLRILKTSSDGKKEGFTFKVEGEGYSQTFVTDKNGEIFIENLRVGKYTVSEVATDATKDYKLPDAVEIEIIADETLEVKVHNDKITVEYPPKTGDDSNVWLWVVLALLSGLGLAATLVIPKLRKKTRKASSR